jgi:hypothetical protein
VGVADPAGDGSTSLEQPPPTCSLVWVPLVHTALLYDVEWTGRLVGRRGRADGDFLERLELCVRGWERLFPDLYRRWAQVIGRSTDARVRQARAEVGNAVVEMFRVQEERPGAGRQERTMLLLPFPSFEFPSFEESRTVGWVPYHQRSVQESCMRAFSGTETTLMEACLTWSLGISSEAMWGARVRGEAPRSTERVGPQTARGSDGGGRSFDPALGPLSPAAVLQAGGGVRGFEAPFRGYGTPRAPGSRGAPRVRARWEGVSHGDGGSHGYGNRGSGRDPVNNYHRHSEWEYREACQEATDFPGRFMVYMPPPVSQFRMLGTLEPSREIGQVDVLVTGREGRWKTVPEGAVRRLDAEWLGRPWDETRLGPCPTRPSQLQVVRLPISREEYHNTRQSLREERNPRDFVDGLRAAVLNIRVMMRDSFGVDVRDIEGAVAQVSRIGLRGVEEEMDEWEQGDVVCTDSPNPQPRKMQTTDRTGESRGRLAQGGRPEPSGVRTRLFGGEEQDDRGGGGVTPRGFATPPHFATNSNVGTGGGGAGDGGRQAGSMLEEAMALVLRQSHLTRHDLAQTNAAVEMLARRGHSAVPDAGAPEKRIVTAVVKQSEGDKYPTSRLILSFMNSCMRSLSEDAPIKQTWLGTGNVRREFPVSSAHACVQYVRQNIREDMEDMWVTNLSEDRKRFYLVSSLLSSLLDPRTKMLSFCDNKYFPSSWKNDALGYLSMDLKSFYVQRTQREVKDSDGQVKHRSDLDELLGMSTVSMDFDVASVEGEAQLQAYMQVQQVTNDTYPLMWWKQHHQELPDLVRMATQYLTVPATSASPERFFSRVGLVQTDLHGSLLDTTMIDLMWAKQVPYIILQEMNEEDTHTPHAHTHYLLTH